MEVEAGAAKASPVNGLACDNTHTPIAPGDGLFLV
jgi:hypothetical protein